MSSMVSGWDSGGVAGSCCGVEGGRVTVSAGGVGRSMLGGAVSGFAASVLSSENEAAGKTRLAGCWIIVSDVRTYWIAQSSFLLHFPL